MLPTAQPKPRRQASVKARNKREEAKIKRVVRALCVARDGDCRIGNWEDNPGDWHDDYLDHCEDGPSEWAHLNEFERSKTRGKAPEERHHTHGSAMLCQFHHQQLHSKSLTVRFLSELGADGPLAWERR